MRLQPLNRFGRWGVFQQPARADVCKDIDKRYRWDLLYRSRIKIGDGVGIQGDVNLYSYMDDNHIDSALRSFIKPLKADS